MCCRCYVALVQLGAISGQSSPGIVLDPDCDIKFNIDGTTYLRQHDLMALDNLTLALHLETCAAIYGANQVQLTEVQNFVRPFFRTKKSD